MIMYTYGQFWEGFGILQMDHLKVLTFSDQRPKDHILEVFPRRNP